MSSTTAQPVAADDAHRSRVSPSPIRSNTEQASSERQGSARSRMWEARRRRKEQAAKDESPDSVEGGEQNVKERRKNRLLRRKEKKKEAAEEELDPYDSDPGESYRQHVQKAKGNFSRSCLGAPAFLKTKSARRTKEEESEITSPPSPLTSELGDPFGQLPVSLPANAALVKYSLRSSITDGSEKQPAGPSVMERRELRPNTVHINVSHWSDPGGRPYMEDRLVTTCIFLSLCHHSLSLFLTIQLSLFQQVCY